jgi:hypothetical protein
MKILASILMLLVFVASVVPCCGEEECEPEAPERSSERTTQDECEDSEVCSPFFMCKSCPGPGHSVQRNVVSAVLSSQSKAPALHTPVICPVFLDGVWHPPKVI